VVGPSGKHEAHVCLASDYAGVFVATLMAGVKIIFVIFVSHFSMEGTQISGDAIFTVGDTFFSLKSLPLRAFPGVYSDPSESFVET
jgi:hypothetical protein